MVKIKYINLEKGNKLVVDVEEIPEKSLIIDIKTLTTTAQIKQKIISEVKEILDRKALIDELKSFVGQEI